MENILIGVVVAFIIFLIIRELVTWYWKINEIIGLLKRNNEINEHIDKLLYKSLTHKQAEIESKEAQAAEIAQ